MKALVLVSASAALAVASSIAPPAIAAPAPQVTQAVAALRAITTMRADFTQTDADRSTVRGVLTLKQPGRIRFQYQADYPLLIVGDGKALTLIDYGVRQVQRWPIGNSPLGALLDPRRDVAAFGTLQPTGNPRVTSILVRDARHPEYGVITLVFVRNAAAPGGLELNAWVATDAQNRRTMVQLSNQRYGLPVPDTTFRWKDPRTRTRP